MPEVEPLRFPSREEHDLQDQEDLQAVCPGRRRRCALVNTPSPCVNKAICHIQELKSKVDNWCQQSGNLQPQPHEKQQYRKHLRFQSHDSDIKSLVTTELFIEGIGLGTRESGPLPPLRKETTDVLVEVLYLIERLEADRQDAEEALQREKRTKRALGSQVDRFSLWKQQEYPLVVQKEHEACTRDITELKWHLKLRKEKLEQVQEKVEHLELLNQRLHEDISFVKKHGPVVKEKLELEIEAMNQMSTAQKEADEMCLRTRKDLNLAEEELKENEQKADNKRRSMELVMKDMRNQLTEKQEELKQLKAHWEVQCTNKKDAEQLAAQKKKLCAAILERIPEMEASETSLNDRVLKLNIEIEGEVRKTAALKEKLTKLQENINKAMLDGEEEVFRLQEECHSKHKALTALYEEQREYEREVQDYKEKISKSEETVRQNVMDKKAMLQEICENEEQRDRAKVELTQVVAQHGAVKTRREEQEQLTFMEEQKARKVTGNLKTELMGEMKHAAMLKSQCAMITEELNQEQLNLELTNQELQKEFGDVSSAMKDLETETEALRKLYNDKSQKIKALTEKLHKIQSEHRTISDSLENEKRLKFDQLTAAKELHSATIKRYEQTLSRISDLSKRSTEYRAASDNMEKTAAAMPETIEELQNVLDTVEFENQSATLIMNTLESDINDYQQRTQQSIKTHTSHLAARQKKMEDTKEALKMALKENSVLACRYTDLQRTLLVARQDAACVLEEKNRVEISFHFQTQLSLLQKRMHEAMVKYFKQRSLYSQAELDRCQALSQETNQKIKTVQEELSKAIRRISAFLQSLTDDSTTTDDGTANKQASPDAVGLNEEMPAVQIGV